LPPSSWSAIDTTSASFSAGAARPALALPGDAFMAWTEARRIARKGTVRYAQPSAPPGRGPFMNYDTIPSLRLFFDQAQKLSTAVPVAERGEAFRPNPLGSCCRRRARWRAA
jgi:hypothetical protein